MREITNIVLHCTATPQTATVESILKFWKEVNKWDKPGYHFIIKPDGEIVELLPIDKVANGAAGHNTHSIHISYIGGIDENNDPVDNRTIEQKYSQLILVLRMKKKVPSAIVLGHTDFPNVSKACPSFNVADWLNEVGI